MKEVEKGFQSNEMLINANLQIVKFNEIFLIGKVTVETIFSSCGGNLLR